MVELSERKIRWIMPLVLKTCGELKVNALTLEHVLRDTYRIQMPHNRIQMILKEGW